MKGLLSYEVPFFGQEGWLAAILLLSTPLFFMWVLTRFFDPWGETRASHA
jgi:hypothetical protein